MVVKDVVNVSHGIVVYFNCVAVKNFVEFVFFREVIVFSFEKSMANAVDTFWLNVGCRGGSSS